MSQELPAKRTQLAPQDMFDVMALVWPAVLQEPSWKPSLLVLLAQWSLETGNGKSMWCYNVGNVKAKPGGAFDYCYFPAGEILKTAYAEAQAAAHPDTVKIKSRFKNGTCEVIFYPKHPACCFRAFHTVEEGVMDYLGLMRRRFAKAWPYVISANPTGFCHALKLQDYYTADEAQYTRSVLGIFDRFLNTIVDLEVPTATEAPSLSEFPVSPVVGVADDDGSPVVSPYSLEMARLASPLESSG